MTTRSMHQVVDGSAFADFAFFVIFVSTAGCAVLFDMELLGHGPLVLRSVVVGAAAAFAGKFD